MNTAQFCSKLADIVMNANQNQEINQVLLTVNYLPVMELSETHNHSVSVNSKDYDMVAPTSKNDGLFCSMKQAMLVDSDKFLSSNNPDYLTDKYNTLHVINKLCNTGIVGINVTKFTRNNTIEDIMKNYQSSKGFRTLVKDYRRVCWGFIDTVHRVPAYPPYKVLKISESDAFEGSGVKLKSSMRDTVTTTSEFNVDDDEDMETLGDNNSEALSVADARAKMQELCKINRMFVELKPYSKYYNNGSIKSQPPYFCTGLEREQGVPDPTQPLHPSTVKVALERNPNVWELDKALRAAYDGSPMSEYIPFEKVHWVLYKSSSENSSSGIGYKNLKPVSAISVFTKEFYEIEQFVLANFKPNNATILFDEYDLVKNNKISEECNITVEQALSIYFRQMLKANIELGEFYYGNTPRQKMPLGAGSLSEFIPVVLKFDSVFNPLTDIYFKIGDTQAVTNLMGFWFPDLKIKRDGYYDSVPLLEKSLSDGSGVTGYFLTRTEATLLIGNKFTMIDKLSDKMYEFYASFLHINSDSFDFRLFTSYLYATLLDLESACDRSYNDNYYYTIVTNYVKNNPDKASDFLPRPADLCLKPGEVFSDSKGQTQLMSLFNLLKDSIDSIMDSKYRIKFEVNSSNLPNNNTLLIEELPKDYEGFESSRVYVPGVKEYYLTYRQYCRFMQILISYHISGENSIRQGLMSALSLGDSVNTDVYQGILRLNELVRKTLRESGFMEE